MKVYNKPIEVIALHKADGNVEPIKFKIEDDNGTNVVKVDRIIDCTKEKETGRTMLRFTCDSVISNVLKRYELRFYQDKAQWYLYKM